MASGNAARKRKQQQQARRRADKSHQRDRNQPHGHLPKVGTRPEQAHLQKQRRADLVAFGAGRRRPALGIALVVLVLAVILAFLAILVLFD